MNLNIRHIILLLASLLPAATTMAQTLKTDDGTSHWEGGFNIGLNNDGYGFELRALYFPLQYVGVKAGLGFAGEIENMEDWGKDEWETGHSYTVRFKFTPAIVLRTPRLIHWKSQDGGFYLFSEPGIILSPGAAGSRNARHCCWDIKAGINFQIDRFIFTLGYGISDFSLYSGSPVNHHGLPSETNYITHTVYIGGAVKF